MYNFLSEAIPRQDNQPGPPRLLLVGDFVHLFQLHPGHEGVQAVTPHAAHLRAGGEERLGRVMSGIRGLFFRGLETKILSKGLQGILFSILWKHFEEALFPKEKKLQHDEVVLKGC